jgi:hypothetical protein
MDCVGDDDMEEDGGDRSSSSDEEESEDGEDLEEDPAIESDALWVMAYESMT